MRVTVIVPTVARPGLRKALASCQGADEVLLAPDGPEALAAVRALDVGTARVLDVGGPFRDWGHGPSNAALAAASGDFIFRLDDDDEYLPGALALVRALLESAPPLPHLFRAGCRVGTVWHTEGRLEPGNVTTAGIAMPRAVARLVRFGPRYEGDFDYFRSAADLCGGRCVWRREVIAGRQGDQR